VLAEASGPSFSLIPNSVTMRAGGSLAFSMSLEAPVWCHENQAAVRRSPPSIPAILLSTQSLLCR